MTEEQLKSAFNSAQNGDREAFGFIYDHFSQKLYRFVFFRIGHKEIAEDILADTFIKAWLKLNHVTSHKAFSSWLYQIAKNNVIDYYRIKKTTIDLNEIAEIIEDSTSPVDDTNLAIEQTLLLKLLDQLPQDQQLIIKYKFFEDLENIEIAQIMNKNEGTIRVLQHRAIAKLKELLNQKKRI